jgi:hypothetical protein
MQVRLLAVGLACMFERQGLCSAGVVAVSSSPQA